MNTQNKISKARDLKWLIFALGIGLVTIFLTVRVSYTWIIWLLAVVIYSVATKKPSEIGITKQCLKKAFLVGLLAGISYGIIRAIILYFVPHSEAVFGAGLLEIINAMEMGEFPIGTITGSAGKIYLIMLLVSTFTVFCWEPFWRGLVLMKVRRFLPWVVSIGIVAIISALPHTESISAFLHSIILGVIGGELMRRHKNVIAPTMFHLTHFHIAFIILWILRY